MNKVEVTNVILATTLVASFAFKPIQRNVLIARATEQERVIFKIKNTINRKFPVKGSQFFAAITLYPSLGDKKHNQISKIIPSLKGLKLNGWVYMIEAQEAMGGYCIRATNGKQDDDMLHIFYSSSRSLDPGDDTTWSKRRISLTNYLSGGELWPIATEVCLDEFILELS